MSQKLKVHHPLDEVNTFLLFYSVIQNSPCVAQLINSKPKVVRRNRKIERDKSQSKICKQNVWIPVPEQIPKPVKPDNNCTSKKTYNLQDYLCQLQQRKPLQSIVYQNYRSKSPQRAQCFTTFANQTQIQVTKTDLDYPNFNIGRKELDEIFPTQSPERVILKPQTKEKQINNQLEYQLVYVPEEYPEYCEFNHDFSTIPRRSQDQTELKDISRMNLQKLIQSFATEANTKPVINLHIDLSHFIEAEEDSRSILDDYLLI